MVNCCVPFCKSESGKKNKLSVSFHDFPLASETLSLQWMNKISRKDWTPSDTSKVCSLHFLPSDYRCGGKLKRLVPTAVPSVFPPHFTTTTKMKMSSKKVPIERNLHSPSEEVSDSVAESPSQVTNVTDKQEPGSSATQEDNVLPDGKQEELSTSGNDEKFRDKELPEKSMEDGSTGTTNESNSDPEIHDELNVTNSNDIPLIPPNESPCASVNLELDSEMKMGIMHMKEINAYKAKLRRRDERIRKLENEVAMLKKRMDASYLEEKFLNDLAHVFKSGREGDVKALFILQQIKSFSHKAAHWDERILKELVVWRTVSLRGYEKAKSNLLVLPHRTTLTAYMGSAKDVDKDSFLDPALPESTLFEVGGLFGQPTSENASNLTKNVVNITENASQTRNTFGNLTHNTLEDMKALASITDNNLETLPGNITTVAMHNITENTFKDIADNPLQSMTDNISENTFENIAGNSFEDMSEHPFENTLDTLSETTLDKLLVNKLENKLEHILENTLDDTLDNSFDKLLANKMGNKLGTCFENTLDDSFENILDNSSENTLENTFQQMLENSHEELTEMPISCKRLKLG